MIAKIAFLLGIAMLALVSAKYYTPQQLMQFNAWQIKHNKVYDTVDAFEHAMENFQATLKRVEAYNTRSNGSNWAGLTKFADLSPAEFKQIYLRATHNEHTAKARAHTHTEVLPRTHQAAPASFDWRTQNPSVLTPVKDQGQCGSCWAFSTTESVESLWARAGNPLVALSPEQIVDCDTVDQGCNGGDTPSGFQYVMEAGGLDTERSYPYTAGSGTSGNCKFKPANVAAQIQGFSWVIPECLGACNSQDWKQVQAHLATVGPFSICVYADPWQDYISGVFNDNSCQHNYASLDHCVQLVGYTSSYWIVRNSWAADWGEDGYIYVSSKEANGNLCGIVDEVNFPKVNSTQPF